MKKPFKTDSAENWIKLKKAGNTDDKISVYIKEAKIYVYLTKQQYLRKEYYINKWLDSLVRKKTKYEKPLKG